MLALFSAIIKAPIIKKKKKSEYQEELKECNHVLWNSSGSHLQLKHSIWCLIDSPSQTIVLLGQNIQEAKLYIVAKAQAK